MPKSRKKVGCPVEVTIRIIGGRWKVLVIHNLLDGHKRFNELQRLLVGIAPRTLTKQLRELESDGIISRTAYPEIPPRVEYELTDLGRSIQPVLNAMGKWGEDYTHRESDHRQK